MLHRGLKLLLFSLTECFFMSSRREMMPILSLIFSALFILFGTVIIQVFRYENMKYYILKLKIYFLDSRSANYNCTCLLMIFIYFFIFLLFRLCLINLKAFSNYDLLVCLLCVLVSQVRANLVNPRNNPRDKLRRTHPADLVPPGNLVHKIFGQVFSV